MKKLKTKKKRINKMGLGTSDLILGAVIVGGGYLILKTTKLGGALGGVGEGVSDVAGGLGEAAAGLGSGISQAGRGLGSGVAELSQQVTSITGDVAELTSFVGEWGLGLAQEIKEIKERSIREHYQETEIDIAAHEIAKDPLIDIQVGKDIILATESAKRSKLITEEKTQVVEFITTAPEKFVTGLSALWRYNPIGLLTSYIQGVVSVEDDAAPQRSAPVVVGAADPSGSRSQTDQISVSTGSGGVAPRYSLKELSEIGTQLEGGGVHRTAAESEEFSQKARIGREVVQLGPTIELSAPKPTIIQTAASIWKTLRGGIFSLF